MKFQEKVHQNQRNKKTSDLTQKIQPTVTLQILRNVGQLFAAILDLSGAEAYKTL